MAGIFLNGCGIAADVFGLCTKHPRLCGMITFVILRGKGVNTPNFASSVYTMILTWLHDQGYRHNNRKYRRSEWYQPIPAESPSATTSLLKLRHPSNTLLFHYPNHRPAKCAGVADLRPGKAGHLKNTFTGITFSNCSFTLSHVSPAADVWISLLHTGIIFPHNVGQ